MAVDDWARQKKDWLAELLDLSSGIASHDRFNAIFRAIKPEQFERCLVAWITELHKVVGQVVPIDGETMRQSFDEATGKSALHMVIAWATSNKISLGQVAVAEKRNEITAIPKLLDLLELSGTVVTIDAMGVRPRSPRISSRGSPNTFWPSKATSGPCMRASRSSSWTRWRTTSPG